MGSDGTRRPRADVMHGTQRAAVERIPFDRDNRGTVDELWINN